MPSTITTFNNTESGVPPTAATTQNGNAAALCGLGGNELMGAAAGTQMTRNNGIDIYGKI